MEISPGSLGLNITYNFRLDVDPGFKQDSLMAAKDVQIVLSLLKEYDEMPKRRFGIDCAVAYEYEPTPAEGKRYGLNSYVDRLVVTTNNGAVTSEYNYNRGSLSSKKVRSNVKGIKSVNVEFIWKGDKLVKAESPLVN